ncbi:acyl-CoA dehydrogenase [Pontibacter sp. G13]|uniref:acyl-CoA dehydrogenase n=1 Tax=Pontibacter sp. G13 TaxID=3074898 RepID=UPI00288B60B3|nr:acyl-CoA dehydrogenase [Pontibacter sp. G13]WNJ15913.1 acyl-CoA dehydrogenase [Pontibacter sp. G13]
MADSYVSLRDLRFLLKQVHRVEDVVAHDYYSHNDEETMDMMLDAAKQLADSYLFPHYESMDRNEPELVGDTISVHESVHPFIRAMADGGWIGAVAPMSVSGMQIPQMLGVCAGFIFSAANNGALGFTGLTTAATNLLVEFGSQEQKDTYLPKMFGGEWQGTMALTEPQAGSSLSDVEAKAIPQPDGTYKIEGQKIFISAGDYEGVENVIHLLLGRIEGAPAGTKGISLFIVPKFRDENGQLVHNDITTAGVYHKLGQKGTPATHLMYGDKGNCVGYLLGEENRGLSYMFKMMNEARLLVGLGGAAIASAAYHASLQYANERPQGRRLNNRNLSLPQTLIKNHPDIQRMLLLQQSVVEGSLSLVLECAKYADMATVSEGEEKERYEMLLDLLTPIAKSFPSEMGITSVSNGLQILGGAGYCKDFPLENLFRDIRIYPIYEGTTGIQAMDLLGRKVTMKAGKAVQLYMKEVQETIDAVESQGSFGKYAAILKEKLKKIQEVSMHLAGFAMKGDIERFLMDATLYLEFFGIVAIAWQWLKQGHVAQLELENSTHSTEERLYLEGKIRAMKYYFHYEVPKTLGLIERLMDDEVLTILPEPEKA